MTFDLTLYELINKDMTEYNFILPERFQRYKETIDNLMKDTPNHHYALKQIGKDPFLSFAYKKTLLIPEMEAEYTWNWLKENKDELGYVVFDKKWTNLFFVAYATIYTKTGNPVLRVDCGIIDELKFTCKGIKRFKNKLKRFGLNNLETIKHLEPRRDKDNYDGYYFC